MKRNITTLPLRIKTELFNGCNSSCVMGREKERKKTRARVGLGSEDSDKLSDKGRARARLYIHSLVSIKSSPSAQQKMFFLTKGSLGNPEWDFYGITVKTHNWDLYF